MALVLSVGESESVWIGSAKVTIVRTGQRGGNVKLAIEAPRETNIVRDEVKRRDEAAADAAITSQIQPANVDDLGRRSEGL